MVKTFVYAHSTGDEPVEFDPDTMQYRVWWTGRDQWSRWYEWNECDEYRLGDDYLDWLPDQ